MTSARSYRPDIDGLRAIAVLAVVGFHTFPNIIRGGFVGVDVFFVISGYLITGILLEESREGAFRIMAFYRRRVQRILPALLAVLACSLAFGWFVLLSNEFRQLGRHVLGGSLFASNIVLWGEAGYFDNSAETKPLLHLWSLAIEEQFYILLPCVLLLCRRFKASPLRWLLLAAGASLACNIALIRSDLVGTFYSPITRAWELLVGSLLACVQVSRHGDGELLARLRAVQRRRRNLFGLVGLACIGIAALLYDKAMDYPGAPALLPVVGATLLIAAGPSAWTNRRLLSMRLLVAIGLISYPLYLWHWPILKFFLITGGDLITAGMRLVLIAVSFVLAAATTRWIEGPLRRSPDRRVALRLLALLGVAGVVGAAAASGLIASRQRADGLERIVHATSDWQYPPPHFQPLLHEGDRFYHQRTPNPQTTLFIGDSNVEQYAPRISAQLNADPVHHRSVVFATRGGCLPVPGLNPPHLACSDRLEGVLRYARRPEIDTVVIGGYWPLLPEGAPREDALRSLGRLIADLSRTRRVFLLLAIPGGPEFDPRNMFEGSRLTQLKPKEKHPQFRLSRFLDSYGPLHDRLVSTGTLNGATLLDPLAWLCAGDICPVQSEQGEPFYMDEHHMRPFHVLRGTGYIDAAIDLPSTASPAPPAVQAR